MVQIATTRTGQAAAEAPKAVTQPRAGNVARDLTDRAQGTTLRLIDKAAPAEDKAATSLPAAPKPSVVLPLQAVALEMNKAGSAMVGFWLQQGNDQLVHHARTVKKLAAVRDWRETLAIQSAFLHDSLARLNQGAARYVDVTGTMVARLREARAGGALVAAASTKGQQR